MKIKNPVFPWVQKVPMGSHVTFNEKKIIFGHILMIFSFLDNFWWFFSFLHRFWWSFNFRCPSTCSMMILNFWADYNNFSNFWVDFDDFFSFLGRFWWFLCKIWAIWPVTGLRRLHCSNAIWIFFYFYPQCNI